MSKVAVRRCSRYERERVHRAVSRIFADLGVVKDMLPRDGGVAFLKVNLLWGSPPEMGVITHPNVVEATASLLKDAGMEVVIGDSPGGHFTKDRLKGSYRKARLDLAARRSGASLNYDTSIKKVEFPEGRLLKRFSVVKAMSEADFLLNMPKMKTHVLTTFTGATKNLYGAIPGITKVKYHARFPSIKNFSHALLDILTFLAPPLSLMDGIQAMEGTGPSRGKPKYAGVLLGSGDAAALDTVACSILGIPIRRVPPLMAARKRGIGETRIERIDILGNTLDSVRVEKAKLPSTVSRARVVLPTWLDRKLTRLLAKKPYVKAKSCVGCGVCQRNCPRKCISLDSGKAVIDLGRCQRCYCCHELCPHDAVGLR